MPHGPGDCILVDDLLESAAGATLASTRLSWSREGWNAWSRAPRLPTPRVLQTRAT